MATAEHKMSAEDDASHDLLPAGWLLDTSSAADSVAILPIQHRSTVLSLATALRTAEGCALLSQIESCLRLYQLRELFQQIEAEQDRANLKSHTQPHSSMFAAFLGWTYGKEEGAARNTQLQRLSNWFCWKSDMSFYQLLLASHTTAVASLGDRKKVRLATISYFYEISPRLPQLIDSLKQTPFQLELKVHGYLATRPLSQLRDALAADFAGFKRLPAEEVVVAQEEKSTAMESSMLQMVVDAAVKLEETTASSPLNLQETPKRLATAAAVSNDTASPLPPPIKRAVTPPPHRPTRTIPAPKHTIKMPPSLAQKHTVAAAAAASSSYPGQKRKREASESRHQKQKTIPEAASAFSASSPPLACIGASAFVPIELIRMGIIAWEKQRRSGRENAAMDDALVKLARDLAGQLPNDGPKINFNLNRKDSERHCVVLRDIIDKIETNAKDNVI